MTWKADSGDKDGEMTIVMMSTSIASVGNGDICTHKIHSGGR